MTGSKEVSEGGWVVIGARMNGHPVSRLEKEEEKDAEEEGYVKKGPV